MSVLFKEKQVINKDEINNRREKLRAALINATRSGAHAAYAAALRGIAPQDTALLLACPPNIIYAAGHMADAFFFLPAVGEARLFVRRPKGLNPACFIGCLVDEITKVEQIPDILSKSGQPQPKALALEDEQLSYAEVRRVLAAFGDIPMIPAGSAMARRTRAVKTDYEVELIRESSASISRAFASLPDIIKPGMTDVEVCGEFSHELSRRGNLGLIRGYGRSFETPSGCVLLTGDNALQASAYDFALPGGGRSPALPVGACGETIATGKTAMVDFACTVNGYIADMSRSYAIGDVPLFAQEAHDATVAAVRAIEGAARPGTSCDELYDIAKKVVSDAGFSEYFMGFGVQSGFVGHGVGLELNELPILAPKMKTELLPGMTIAVEPKMALPGIGAVGVENTYVVTDDGLSRLTDPDDVLIRL